ncbi:MAG TPA: DUF3054 domain-containing protein [Aggregatilineales bacterium]|nr:DUF3054 domain-containing protein [Chloroflexota bacterium]HOA24464.1 DUF3054 domain-containing protein [Aggregatilineales bacterium]HQA67377.1 DUF3054 domain-containing protein [Aggregatilineales bacterium]HQE17464.1 DUF3054 domain-containing protein [Aggregatilineales bacterium]
MSADTSPNRDNLTPPGASAPPDLLPTWEMAALFVGDFLVLVLFAAVGRTSHSMEVSTRVLPNIINTAAPMMLGWLLSGMLTGIYTATGLHPPRRVVLRTLLAGLIGGPIGVALRALWLGRPIILTFVLVATGTSTLMMLAWRFGWSRLRRLWWPELP